MAIYSYFAEAERDFISIWTKPGLAAAEASGKILGRPSGARNKHSVLDAFYSQIKEYVQLGIPLRRIRTILNLQLPKKLTYSANIHGTLICNAELSRQKRDIRTFW